MDVGKFQFNPLSLSLMRLVIFRFVLLVIIIEYEYNLYELK